MQTHPNTMKFLNICSTTLGDFSIFVFLEDVQWNRISHFNCAKRIEKLMEIIAFGSNWNCADNAAQDDNENFARKCSPSLFVYVHVEIRRSLTQLFVLEAYWRRDGIGVFNRFIVVTLKFNDDERLTWML